MTEDLLVAPKEFVRRGWLTMTVTANVGLNKRGKVGGPVLARGLRVLLHKGNELRF
jgi:hypothetical protein